MRHTLQLTYKVSAVGPNWEEPEQIPPTIGNPALEEFFGFQTSRRQFQNNARHLTSYITSVKQYEDKLEGRNDILVEWHYAQCPLFILRVESWP